MVWYQLIIAWSSNFWPLWLKAIDNLLPTQSWLYIYQMKALSSLYNNHYSVIGKKRWQPLLFAFESGRFWPCFSCVVCFVIPECSINGCIFCINFTSVIFSVDLTEAFSKKSLSQSLLFSWFPQASRNQNPSIKKGSATLMQLPSNCWIGWKLHHDENNAIRKTLRKKKGKAVNSAMYCLLIFISSHESNLFFVSTATDPRMKEGTQWGGRSRTHE